MKKAPQTYTVGRRAFVKISEVEGIRLTKEMDEDFRVFDQRNLSPKDRRQAIARKYGR